jgi:hypothetical protein
MKSSARIFSCKQYNTIQYNTRVPWIWSRRKVGAFLPIYNAWYPQHKPPFCRVLQGVPHKMCQDIIWVILSRKYYINICPIINRHVATRILIIQDTLRHCAVSSVIKNQLHTHSNLFWKLLPRNFLLRDAELYTQQGGGNSAVIGVTEVKINC